MKLRRKCFSPTWRIFVSLLENRNYLRGSGYRRGSELIGVIGGIGADRSGSEWIGADRSGSELIGVDRRDRSGSELIGVDRSESELIGVDRSESEWIGTLTSNLFFCIFVPYARCDCH